MAYNGSATQLRHMVTNEKKKKTTYHQANKSVLISPKKTNQTYKYVKFAHLLHRLWDLASTSVHDGCSQSLQSHRGTWQWRFHCRQWTHAPSSCLASTWPLCSAEWTHSELLQVWTHAPSSCPASTWPLCSAEWTHSQRHYRFELTLRVLVRPVLDHFVLQNGHTHRVTTGLNSHSKFLSGQYLTTLFCRMVTLRVTTGLNLRAKFLSGQYLTTLFCRMDTLTELLKVWTHAPSSCPPITWPLCSAEWSHSQSLHVCHVTPI